MKVDLDRPPQPPPGPDLMTVPEIAACLRMSRWHVARALESGALPGAFRLPGGVHWRAPRKSVAAHMARTWSGPSVWEPVP